MNNKVTPGNQPTCREEGGINFFQQVVVRFNNSACQSGPSKIWFNSEVLKPAESYQQAALRAINQAGGNVNITKIAGITLTDYKQDYLLHNGRWETLKSLKIDKNSLSEFGYLGIES